MNWIDKLKQKARREWERLLRRIVGIEESPNPPTQPDSTAGGATLPAVGSPSGAPWTPIDSAWIGPNFSGATREPRAVLHSASIDAAGKRLTLDYDPLPGDWPRQVNAPGMLCLFTRQSDGRWRGGKFEWLDPGQRVKLLHNIDKGYNGWQRPAKGSETAIVIFHVQGRTHSNPAYTRYGQ
jgi:hypothetical protein